MPYFHLYINVLHGEEEQGAPGLAWSVSRHTQQHSCLRLNESRSMYDEGKKCWMAFKTEYYAMIMFSSRNNRILGQIIWFQLRKLNRVLLDSKCAS